MKLIALGLVAVILTACTTGEKASELDLGMTPDQVIAVLGRPDGQSQQGTSLAISTLTASFRPGVGIERTM